MSLPRLKFILGYRAMMLDGLAREVEITKRVLAAVPEGKRDYRPDPHARTAWNWLGIWQYRCAICGWHCRFEVRNGESGGGRQAENGSRTGRLV